MLISVVIPVYNKRKSIRRTVESVLNQTYKDYELLVVDDGSTDGSMDELNSIKDSRLKCFYKKNSGVSDTRNYAMEKASGDIVAFLDGDDLWHSEFIESMLNIILICPSCRHRCWSCFIKKIDGGKM